MVHGKEAVRGPAPVSPELPGGAAEVQLIPDAVGLSAAVSAVAPDQVWAEQWAAHLADQRVPAGFLQGGAQSALLASNQGRVAVVSAAMESANLELRKR